MRSPSEDKPKPVPAIEVSAEVASAIYRAATNSGDHAYTTGSEHAVRVKDGVVKVELPTEGHLGRKTVTVVVPPVVSFVQAE